MKLYTKNKKVFFKNRNGDLEYGPYDSRLEARRALKQYLTFLKYATDKQDKTKLPR